MLTQTTFTLVKGPDARCLCDTILRTSSDINEINALFLKYENIPGMSIERHIRPIKVFSLDELREQTVTVETDGICHDCKEHSSPVYYLDEEGQITDGPESECCGAGIEVY